MQMRKAMSGLTNDAAKLCGINRLSIQCLTQGDPVVAIYQQRRAIGRPVACIKQVSHIGVSANMLGDTGLLPGENGVIPAEGLYSKVMPTEGHLVHYAKGTAAKLLTPAVSGSRAAEACFTGLAPSESSCRIPRPMHGHHRRGTGSRRSLGGTRAGRSWPGGSRACGISLACRCGAD